RRSRSPPARRRKRSRGWCATDSRRASTPPPSVWMTACASASSSRAPARSRRRFSEHGTWRWAMPWPRPSLPDLIRRTAEDFRSRLPGDAFLRHSFEWALSRVIAGLTHGLYGHQEWLSRQAVPGPDADDETILQWAALFLDPPRILATRAKGQVTFTGNDGVTVPPGT